MTEREEWRLVLFDILEERGIPAWVNKVIDHRKEYYNIIRYQVTSCPCPHGWWTLVSDYHNPGCKLGELLLALGGREELRRQHEVGHIYALREMGYWNLCWTEAMTGIAREIYTAGAKHENDSVALRELLRAGTIAQNADKSFSINGLEAYVCGFCRAIGYSHHQAGCPNTNAERHANTIPGSS